MKIANTPSITNDSVVNVNRAAIEHRATWMGLTYEAAKEARIDGEPILRHAVSRTGCLHGSLIAAKLKPPFSMKAFGEAFLSPAAIKTFEMEFKAKSERRLEIRFHYCPLVAGWMKAGIDDETIETLCDIAMDGDRNIAETTGVGFALGKTIAAGDDICEVDFFKQQ